MPKLPETDLTASLKFNDRQQAEAFAKAWTRRTLMGHTITGSTVDVYNVTDESMDFINEYANNLNNTNR